MVVYACNLKTQEAEEEGSRVQSQLQLHNKFKASLNYMKPYQKSQTKAKQTCSLLIKWEKSWSFCSKEPWQHQLNQIVTGLSGNEMIRSEPPGGRLAMRNPRQSSWGTADKTAKTLLVRKTEGQFWTNRLGVAMLKQALDQKRLLFLYKSVFLSWGSCQSWKRL